MPERASDSVVVWSDTWLPTPLTFVRDQVRFLTRWHASKVGLYRSPEPMLEPDLAPFAETTSGRLLRRAGGMSARRRDYMQFFDRRRTRLVHAHFASGGINCLPFVEHSALPFIVTFHGQDVTSAPYLAGYRGAVYRRKLRLLFDRADRLIAVSDFIGRSAGPARRRPRQGGAPLHRNRTGRRGQRVARHAGPARHCLRRPTGREEGRVGSAARGRAASVVCALDAGHDHRVRAARDAPARTRGRSRRGSTVRGSVDSTAVRAFLRAARVFCGPSQTARDGDAEGLGMVFLEAGSQGCPVVAYRHGGVVEAVRDEVTGVLVAEGDIDALSAALARLLTDTDLATAMGVAGRAHIRETFDLALRTRELESLYDEVAGSVRG